MPGQRLSLTLSYPVHVCGQLEYERPPLPPLLGAGGDFAAGHHGPERGDHGVDGRQGAGGGCDGWRHGGVIGAVMRWRDRCLRLSGVAGVGGQGGRTAEARHRIGDMLVVVVAGNMRAE